VGFFDNPAALGHYDLSTFENMKKIALRLEGGDFGERYGRSLQEASGISSNEATR
jgi:hypothetical protein